MLKDSAERARTQVNQDWVVAKAEASLSCPICHSIADHLDTSSAFELRRCFACHTVFLDTSPRPMVDYAWELEQQFFGAEFVAEDTNWVAHYEKWNNQRVLRRLPQPGISGRTRLLEVGIGSGRFLSAAAKSGWQVAGIEASSAIAKHVGQRYGVSVFVGSLDEYDDSLGTGFDVVIMNHVLEHLTDPKKALLQIKTLLNPGGVLHLAVPNFNCWEANFSGWTSYQPYHLYYFERESLTYLVRDCGFKIKRIACQEPFSGWVNTIARSVLGINGERTRLMPAGHSPTPRSSKAKILLHDGFNVMRLIVGGILLPLRILQSSVGRGEELILLASPLDNN